MLEIKTVRGTETREVVSQKEWLAARLELRRDPDRIPTNNARFLISDGGLR